jgi:DNA polymerase III alpha subunit (gram-positive type)
MITEIAAEYHVNGKKVKEFFTEVKAVPQATSSISLQALKVTDKSLEYVLTKGDDEGVAIMNFIDWLLKLNTDKISVCGHNVGFDLGFIKALFKKYRIENYDSIINYRTEDTCCLARTFVKAGLLPEGCTALGKLVKFFDIKMEQHEKLHNAGTDTRLTAEVYYRLLNILTEKNNGQKTI